MWDNRFAFSKDGKGNIGYATSTDGISWNVYSSPVLIAGAQSNWDAASVAEPDVVKVGTTYHMFYSALDQWAVENFQVGYASSTDGINWVKSTQNPVLKTESVSQWDRYGASHPGVIYDSLKSKFRMWFTGRDTSTISSLTGYYGDAEIIIYSQLGQIVKRTPNINNRKTILNTFDLADGLYFIVVKNGGEQLTGKLIINK